MEFLRIKKVNPNAIIPRRATTGSAGIDLCACIETPVCIKRGEIVKIPTGIACAVDEKYVSLVFARSGLAVKHGVSLANSVGVIDSDYRGEIIVGLINHGTEDYTVQPNERIAQLVVLPLAPLMITECETLDDSDRGDGGFGSTGKK